MKREMITGFIASLLAFALAIPAGMRLQQVRIETRRLSSDAAAFQLRTALITYHERNGRFPPRVFQESADGPKHSWRVLLLPYLGNDAIGVLEKYDLTQPWDSAENVRALGSIKHNPYFSLEDTGEHTSFLAIDDQMNWPSKFPLRTLVVTQGEHRFMIVEDSDSRIPWMQPEF